MVAENYILLTIDVEDWFQVENFRPWIPFHTWDQRELRVERNTHQLLDLFDSIELKIHNSARSADKETGMGDHELEIKGQRTAAKGKARKFGNNFRTLYYDAKLLLVFPPNV